MPHIPRGPLRAMSAAVSGTVTGWQSRFALPPVEMAGDCPLPPSVTVPPPSAASILHARAGLVAVDGALGFAGFRPGFTTLVGGRCRGFVGLQFVGERCIGGRTWRLGLEGKCASPTRGK